MPLLFWPFASSSCTLTVLVPYIPPMTGPRMLLRWLLMQRGILSYCEGDIQHPTRPRVPTRFASFSSPAHPPPLVSLPATPPLECSGQATCYQPAPCFEWKGLLKFIRGLRAPRSSWSACHIPAVPAQDRGDRAERTAFYLGLFMDPFSLLSPLVPVDIAFC